MVPFRDALVAALTMALLLSGGQGFDVMADTNPMVGKGETYVADPEAVDDEPQTDPAPAAPSVPAIDKAAPRVPAGKALTAPAATNDPLPPRRPFTEQAVQAPPQTQPSQPEPETAEEGEPEAPAASGQKVSREELEQEEAKAPEPAQVEKQTEAVNIACLRPELMDIVQRAGQHFGGTPVITSGQRFRGRRGSYHRKCMAADFIIPGIDRSRLASFLRSLPEAGGVGTYCHTKAVHIDIGDPRNWYQCGFRFRFAQR